MQAAKPAPKIHLPPPFTLKHSNDSDLFGHAMAQAAEDGAGTLYLHEGPGLCSFALVLEPEEPLATSQLAFLLCMTALADALAAHCAPERAVRVNWPDEIIYDKARLGGARFGVPAGTAEGDVPDWLVFCAELIADRDQLAAPGEAPNSTSLKEEEFDPTEDMIATFASYVMLYLDRWKHEGFDAVSNRFLMRIDPPLLRGVRRVEGNRLIEITPSGGGKRSAPLLEAAGKTGWRNATGIVL
ncbi:biotin/lipoate--protein ligase family protein [Roseibaca calidilacus]|nr:biotin/lipoate--protein ligase family protein [Roseibaca calidilacus]